MATPFKCLTCGEKTKIVTRKIGFFGLQETRAKWCRECLPAAAIEAGLDPEAVLASYDQCVEDCETSIRTYRERKDKQAAAREQHHG